MRIPKLRLVALALVSGVALGGCAYGDMGYGGYGGYGGGYGGYGYPTSSVSIGVGYGGGYGYNPYGGYGYGYGSPFGWYDDFYYPGNGIYVYDSYRRPRVWNDRQRDYWTHRNGNWNQNGNWNHNGSGHDGNWNHGSRPNWSGFDRHQNANGITIRGSKYYDERNDRRH